MATVVDRATAYAPPPRLCIQIVYTGDLKFEWDPRKRALNLRKHGIAFEDAVKVFSGSRLETPDDAQGDGEGRLRAFGEENSRVLVVVFAWRGETRRIISARKATRFEREEYYRALYSQ